MFTIVRSCFTVYGDPIHTGLYLQRVHRIIGTENRKKVDKKI